MKQVQVKITVGDIQVAVTLNDTNTAKLLWSELPIESTGTTWGDEIYFRTPIQSHAESPREIVDMGDVGYWPPGQALCLFFGPTPVSRHGEIRPASPVNVVGKMDGDPTVLRNVKSGSQVLVEKG